VVNMSPVVLMQDIKLCCGPSHDEPNGDVHVATASAGFLRGIGCPRQWPALRLDESFVQGCMGRGAEYAMHHCLFNYRPTLVVRLEQLVRCVCSCRQ